MTVFDQPRQSRYIISFLNYPAEFPANCIDVFRFCITPSAGRVIERLIALPGESLHPATLNASGSLEACVEGLKQFQMFAATYASGSMRTASTSH
jgi:hypothetical protein